jgi:hypothetical protein
LKEEFYISLVGEAFDGYTEASFNNCNIYIKHISIRDQRYLHKYYQRYKDLAVSKGLELEKDRIAYVLEEEIWDEGSDLKISSLETEIGNLNKTIRNLTLRSQKEQLQETILQRAEELYVLKSDRSKVMGQTAEDYATSRSGDEILRFLIFKNKELTEHLYSEEDFGELETWEIIELTRLQNDITERLSDENIQKAVLRPSFSMYLSLCEDCGGFYRKAITELTIYQLRVALFGRMFYNIFQHTEDIPDDYRQDPEKLINFSNSKNQRSGSSGIKDDSSGSVLFGATKDDVEDLGGVQGISLAEEAKKHGGQLDMTQMMRLAGHDV